MSNDSTHPIFEKIKQDRPSVHVKQDGSYRCIGLNTKVLDYLFSQLNSGFNTLETGCGLSTLLFALVGCHHTAVVPNHLHIEETKQTANNYQINLDKTTFIEDRSEKYLPTWSIEKKLDVVLIDGGHAFPIPMIDWFYTQEHLRESGLLIIDDIGLKSVSVLIEFLKMQPQWEYLQPIHKTAFFRKISNQPYEQAWDYWKKQPYNRHLDTKIRQLYYAVRHKLRL